MGAALRIVLEVVLFRLRRLEMANLAAAFALLVALRVPLQGALLAGLAAALINVLAYLVNDFVDRDQDLAQGRELAKTRFLVEHPRAALLAQALLAALVAALALVARSPSIALGLVLGVGICWVYTRWLKRAPLLDVLAMAAWGAAMPLPAVPLDSDTGLLLLGQLALFSAVFESIQVLRDRDEDQRAGVRTTAVALGASRTAWLVRGLMLLAAGYGALFVQRWAALGLLLAPLLPVPARPEASPDGDRAVTRYWNRVRLSFGLVWLAELAHIYFLKETFGLLG